MIYDTRYSNNAWISLEYFENCFLLFHMLLLFHTFRTEDSLPDRRDHPTSNTLPIYHHTVQNPIFRIIHPSSTPPINHSSRQSPIQTLPLPNRRSIRSHTLQPTPLPRLPGTLPRQLLQPKILPRRLFLRSHGARDTGGGVLVWHHVSFFFGVQGLVFWWNVD